MREFVIAERKIVKTLICRLCITSRADLFKLSSLDAMQVESTETSASGSGLESTALEITQMFVTTPQSSTLSNFTLQTLCACRAKARLESTCHFFQHFCCSAVQLMTVVPLYTLYGQISALVCTAYLPKKSKDYFQPSLRIFQFYRQFCQAVRPFKAERAVQNRSAINYNQTFFHISFLSNR